MQIQLHKLLLKLGVFNVDHIAELNYRILANEGLSECEVRLQG
jgi:hypothetical protein